MKQATALLSLLFACLVISSGAFAVEIDQNGFNDADGFELAVREDGLKISWDAPEGRAFMELQFIPRRRNRPPAPLIRAIGVDGIAALRRGRTELFILGRGP